MPAEEFRSKRWEEFALTNAPALDFAFSVCDNAAGLALQRQIDPMCKTGA